MLGVDCPNRISYGVSNLKVSSVQHVDCDGGECNHNEVESYVVLGSHITMYRFGQGLAVGSGATP